MLAIPDISDWIETIIVVVIVVGSALSGIVKTIMAKLNRSREEVEAERKLQDPSTPRQMMERPAMPPVARPMPPRRPAATYEHRPVAWPVAQPATPRPETPKAEVPKAIPPVVQTILDVVLDGAVDVEEVIRRPPPRPARPQPPPTPRPGKTKVSKSVARRRNIEEREEKKAKLVEKRIGHIEAHVAPASQAPLTEAESELFERPTRKDLRRAIILNEILSPPLALRQPA